MLIDKSQLIIKFASFVFLLALITQVNAGVHATVKDEFEYYDEQLNIIYKQIIKKLFPPRQTKLRKSQRAWIVFRDLDCAWAFDKALLGCLLSRTKNRLADLQNTDFSDINDHYISIEGTESIHPN